MRSGLGQHAQNQLLYKLQRAQMIAHLLELNNAHQARNTGHAVNMTQTLAWNGVVQQAVEPDKHAAMEIALLLQHAILELRKTKHAALVCKEYALLEHKQEHAQAQDNGVYGEIVLVL